ncbi:hypothetical protein ACJJTC_002338 [Scirpophaga incertulas]
MLASGVENDKKNYLIEEENQSKLEENDDKNKENQTAEEKNDDKNDEVNQSNTEKSVKNNEDKNRSTNKTNIENKNEDEETDRDNRFVPSEKDFSSGSGDDYVPNSESEGNSTSDSCPPKKRNRVPVTIYESCDTSSSELSIKELIEENAINEREENEQIVDATKEVVEDNLEEPSTSFGNKKGRKVRQSLKERREDRTSRLFLRNSGKAYVTKLGKIKKDRNLAPLTACRMKCGDRILHDVREYIFKQYWNLGSYDERAKYVARFITLKNKKSAKTGAKRKRENTMYYKLIYFADEYKICKGCLLKTLGETSRFLQTICEKLKKYGHVTKSLRGRAASYKKISHARLQIVEDHIKKFPAYQSHYSRSKTSKKYLSPGLTLETMYRLYAIENDDPVSKTVYNKVFKDLNLSFKKPRIDTCNKCNLLQNKLKYLTDNDEVQAVQQQLNQHQEDYESAYNEKRLDKMIAKSNSETCVIAFDLQQCLPTPMLSTQSAFYKRQLWVFNLTIHDFETDNAYCYMWPESSGGRGANQIASCLYDFIIVRLPLLHPTSKHLIMYSDSCSGQNKNSIVTTALMIALKDSAQLSTINHKFLIPGHTHMEVDSDHALIEKAKKRTSMNIHHPRDWCQLVRTASNRTNKFSVIEMDSNDFYDFAKFIKQHLLVKKHNSIGQKFTWNEIRSMNFVNNQFLQFTYKTSFKDTSNFYSMSYTKRNKDYEFVTIDTVEKCYSGPNPISKQKKKDLISLLEYIDPCVHDFYHQLLTNEDLHDIDPDLASNEDE